MSNFLDRGHAYQTTKTFAQASVVTTVLIVSAITAAVLVFTWLFVN
jgi:hypothetical protein